MSDAEGFHIISRNFPDGRRIIAAVNDSDEPGRKTDEEILDQIEADMNKRHLRAVADPE